MKHFFVIIIFININEQTELDFYAPYQVLTIYLNKNRKIFLGFAMKKEFLCSEALEYCCDQVRKVINDLGYKIMEDAEQKITASHDLSLYYYPHELTVEFFPDKKGTRVKISIEHRFAETYINKIIKRLKKTIKNLKEKAEESQYEFFVGKNVKREWIKEIRERVLSPDEKLLAVIRGAIESEWIPFTPEVDKSKKGFVIPRKGVLGCTTHKIFFYMPKILGRYEVETAPLDQVSSIQFTKGLLQGRIHVTVFNDEKVIKWVDNEDGAIITKIIERECQKTKRQKQIIESKDEDPLKILKLRYAKGEISKEEYEEIKKELENS